MRPSLLSNNCVLKELMSPHNHKKIKRELKQQNFRSANFVNFSVTDGKTKMK